MTDSATPETTKPLPLISRIIGIITSPRATFQNVVAAPRPVGVLFIVATIIGIGSIAPQMTEKGRQAAVDMQIKTMERFGQTVTPELQQQFEEGSKSPIRKVASLIGTYVFVPIVALVFAGVYFIAFNVVLGGTASFKQVLAVVTHSQVIGAVGMLAALPITMATGKMTMSGPFNLGALAPGLDANSTLATFLGSVSVFGFWSCFVTAIGLAVLYKRNSTNIAITLIALYLLFMFGIAAVVGRFMGA